MARIRNPFVVTGKIAPEYFCDRVEESARLIKSVTNGNNLVIISPRRMGKTGLIQFCYDKPEIRIIRKTKRFAIPERAVYFLKTKRTAGGTPPPQNIFDRLTPVFT